VPGLLVSFRETTSSRNSRFFDLATRLKTRRLGSSMSSLLWGNLFKGTWNAAANPCLSANNQLSASATANRNTKLFGE
jgi:hypothetical protein